MQMHCPWFLVVYVKWACQKTSFGHSRSKSPPPQSHMSLEIISPERYHLKAGIQKVQKKTHSRRTTMAL